MTQAPTPGPLSAEDVKLLVKGDLLLCKTWGVVRFDRFDDSGVRAFVLDLANDQVRLMKPINMAFIGRPDADGWMPWSGSENPVPGQRVSVRLRDGAETDPEPSNMVFWRHQNQRFDVIAFRLAPTAPVEASGSERELTAAIALLTEKADQTDAAASKVEDWHSAMPGDVRAEMKAEAAAIRTILAALHPQPSGETREWSQEQHDHEALTTIAEHLRDNPAAPYSGRQCEEFVLSARDALLSARPLALGGQHSGGEDFVVVPINPSEEMLKAGNQALSPWVAPAMHAGDAYQAMIAARHFGSRDHIAQRVFDCPELRGEFDMETARKVANFILSTTPARAEAQDEGAAEERIKEWLYEMEGFGYRAERLSEDIRMCGPSIDRIVPWLEAAFVLGAAHPSPIPAADADRVRIAVEAEKAISGTDIAHIRHSDGGVALAKKVVNLKAAVQALAALKSEGK